MLSPPSRRRGLKQNAIDLFAALVTVASFAEAWIETSSNAIRNKSWDGRLLRGGVD